MPGRAVTNPTFAPPPSSGPSSGGSGRQSKSTGSGRSKGRRPSGNAAPSRGSTSIAKPPPRPLKSKNKTWSPTNPPCRKFDPKKNGYLPRCFFDNPLTAVNLNKSNAFGHKLLVQSATDLRAPNLCCCCCCKTAPYPIDTVVAMGEPKWNSPVVMTGDWVTKGNCCSPCFFDFQPGLATDLYTHFEFQDAAGSTYKFTYPKRKSGGCCSSGSSGSCCSCSCTNSYTVKIYTVEKNDEIVASASHHITESCCSDKIVTSIADAEGTPMFEKRVDNESCCSGCCVKDDSKSGGCNCCGSGKTRSWFTPWNIAGEEFLAADGPLKGQVAARIKHRYAWPEAEYSCCDSCCCASDLHVGKKLPNMPLYHSEIELPPAFVKGIKYPPAAWQGLLGWLLMVSLPDELNSEIYIGTSASSGNAAGGGMLSSLWTLDREMLSRGLFP
mmetsp:Transcript_357/g.950  ORF Transcript_357/g.950 Transcript_357/m.950 type:complete len:439 (-) Transcript_357:204-1520(-)